MPGDGLLTDAQPLGNGPVGPAGGHETEHLDLSASEAPPFRRCGGLRERFEATHVRRGAEGGKRVTGGVELDDGRVLVTECSVGEPDERPRAGRLVRCLDRVPTSCRLTQLGERGMRLTSISAASWLWLSVIWGIREGLGAPAVRPRASAATASPRTVERAPREPR